MPSFKIVVGALFGLLLSAVIALGIVSYKYNEQVMTTSFWVNHTCRVLLVTDEMLSLFREGHTGGELNLKIEEIRSLCKDNPLQLSLIDSLSVLTKQEKLASFTSIVTNIRDNEIGLLHVREEDNNKSIALFNSAFRQLLAVIGLLSVVTFFSIRYNFNRLIKIDAQIRLAQEKTEKALAAEIELSKLKSNFIALASHEFRTPLTTVLSSAALLENYSVGENRDKASKHIARIKSSVNSLTSILDEFLSLSKIEEGRIQLNYERLDLRQHLQECISNLQTFAKPGQTIHYTHIGPVEVETDPVIMTSIITNLVTNAIKYSPEISTIYVMSYFNDAFHLLVRDEGIGIPEEDINHVFEKFYRGSNAGNVQGTGLGLHIMKHYVDMLNGSVSVESKPGKGTIVTVTLRPAN